MIDWDAISAQLGSCWAGTYTSGPELDSYHFRPVEGAVCGSIAIDEISVADGRYFGGSVQYAYHWLLAYPGDHYHVESIVYAHARLVRSIAGRLGGDEEELYGVGLAKVTELALHGLHKVQDPDKVGSYLGSAARREMSCHKKRWRLAKATDFAWLDEDEDQQVDFHDLSKREQKLVEDTLTDREAPSLIVENKQTWEQIRSVVQDRIDWQVFTMRLERISKEEIGRQLGLSRHQVDRRLRRIMKALKSRFGVR